MRTLIKNPVSYFGVLFLATIFLGIFGCASSKPTPDPLAGFYIDAFHTADSNKLIAHDYEEYIQSLSLRKKDFVGSVDFFDSRTGQHAVDIKIGINGTWWEHILVYDKENKRVKVIKYRNGGYRS
jgi:hypothetical protein